MNRLRKQSNALEIMIKEFHSLISRIQLEIIDKKQPITSMEIAQLRKRVELLIKVSKCVFCLLTCLYRVQRIVVHS